MVKETVLKKGHKNVFWVRADFGHQKEALNIKIK